MDPLSILLLSNNNKSYYEIAFMTIIIPIIGIIINNIKDLLLEYFNYFKRKIEYLLKKNSIEFIGLVSICDNTECIDYPIQIIAICDYLFVNKLAKNFKIYNGQIKQKKYNNYIIENDYIIINNIQIKFSKEKMDTTKSDCTFESNKIKMVISSSKIDLNELNEFINIRVLEYKKKLKNLYKGKIYHFIYQGKKNNKLIWSVNLLSDDEDDNCRNNISFDKLYGKNNEMLKNDMKRLKDLEYYKKHGFKRKKGYLFYGYPGTGKTSAVQAMSNEDKRHIIEIPFSRLETNEELELIFSLKEIEGIEFSQNDIIILFEELDIGISRMIDNDNCILMDYLKNSLKNDKDIKDEKIISEYIDIKKDKDKNDLNDRRTFLDIKDKLDLGMLLTRIDGISAATGIIVIGTTNDPSKICPALRRNGRLSPVFFDYMEQNNIQKMLEDYYEIKFKAEQIKKLPNKDKKIIPPTIIKLLEKYENNVDELLECFDSDDINKLSDILDF
jgi:hypothetical protein